MKLYSFDELLKDSSYIDGKFQNFSSDKFSVVNPASLEVVAEVHNDGTDAVKAAIEVAKESFRPWSNLAPKERAAILEKWNELILAHLDVLAKMMTIECGKPIKESKGEVLYGASFIKWFAEEAKRVYGDIIPAPTTDKRIMTFKQAIGVVGAITPWNFPFAMITRKISPALAAGCSVIVRPSEDTPLTALALGVLAQEAGFPKGVINICVGEDASEMGKVLCTSKDVSKISFTGSTRVGKILMNQGSETLKKLSLELGGNAPFIVFEDADLDAAVAGLMAAKFRNSGQTCVCVNRIFVHDAIYEQFREKFVRKVKELKVGPGLEEENQIGPLIHKRAVEKTMSFIKDAKKLGGKVSIGGGLQQGQFFLPTVIENASPQMKFFSEETFSPIAPLFRFKSDEEVIAMANDTDFGLASYFYTNDLKRMWQISEALEYGMVGVNAGIISNEVGPFGGVKYSGFGREGSKYGIEEYLEIKYVCVGGL